MKTVAFSRDGKALLTARYEKGLQLWPAPDAVQGLPERVRLWIQVTTGSEIDLHGAARVRALDPETWEDRHRELEKQGGLPR